MTRSELLKLGKQCGYWSGAIIEMNDVGIERFAALVAAAEREACANLVYQRCIEWYGEENKNEVQNAIDYAEEIRARGETK